MHFTTFLPFAFCALFLVFPQESSAVATRKFEIDYEANTFRKDGEPFRYIAGTLHYFQIPRELWRDRMLRVRALGCNALQTYVLWNLHQPEDEPIFDFTGDANLTEYLSLAQELGFVVVLRVGPYIDAEMDFGGYPYWLLKNKNITLRSSKDKRYMDAMQQYLDYLLPNIVEPLLYRNNGPIITVHIENEYGVYPECDLKYMQWLKDITVKHLGADTVLCTTDQATKADLDCGAVKGVLPTIAFGSSTKKDVENKYTMLREFMPKGPMVNSEYYPGWMDEWGNAKHTTLLINDTLNPMQYMWDWNVTSFTIYPAHGGTNFGYTAGAENNNGFQGVTTGYDFDAPISEAGDTTPKFIAMRQLIEKLTGKTNPYPIPESPSKFGYGKFRMDSMGAITDLLYAVTPVDRIVKYTYPLTFEQLNQAYGFVLYETTFQRVEGRLSLKLNGARDRAYVILDGQLVSMFQRGLAQTKNTEIDLSQIRTSSTKNESKLQILVENQGRIAYGPDINDPKGLINNVTLNDQILTDWWMYPIDLSLVHKIESTQLQQLIKTKKQKSTTRGVTGYLPSIYYGYFLADSTKGDTFFDPTGWGKGQVFINGRNIGRYWPTLGPQIALYVPSVYLSQDGLFNQIYVLELDQPGLCESDEKAGCWAELVDKHKYVN